MTVTSALRQGGLDTRQLPAAQVIAHRERQPLPALRLGLRHPAAAQPTLRVPPHVANPFEPLQRAQPGDDVATLSSNPQNSAKLLHLPCCPVNTSLQKSGLQKVRTWPLGRKCWLRSGLVKARPSEDSAKPTRCIGYLNGGCNANTRRMLSCEWVKADERGATFSCAGENAWQKRWVRVYLWSAGGVAELVQQVRPALRPHHRRHRPHPPPARPATHRGASV